VALGPVGPGTRWPGVVGLGHVHPEAYRSTRRVPRVTPMMTVR